MSEAEKRRRAAAPTKSLRTFGELTGRSHTLATFDHPGVELINGYFFRTMISSLSPMRPRLSRLRIFFSVT